MGQDIRLKTLNTFTIPALIKFQAENFSAKPALISENETLSFADLDNLSTNIACSGTVLRGKGAHYSYFGWCTGNPAS